MASSDLPNPQSYDSILGDLLSTYAAKTGINDFNIGSAVTSFFETVALTAARSSGDIFQILNDFSIDRATGSALQRLAAENGVTPIVATPATGLVSIIDTSFTKIFTLIYAGTTPPNIGTVTLNISNGASFPATGSVYIGRGTPDIEGPLPYTSVVPTGGYYVMTLSTPTSKYHNLGESVILSQGNLRTIGSGTTIIAPSVGANADIQYTTTSIAYILDGETEVDNVPIVAVLPGSTGNAPIGAINQFASVPFSGATVFNPSSITSGADTETDDQLRTTIKAKLASTGLGTATAIEAAVIGATAPDEQATITSSNIITTTNNATLVIDNGTGYEEKSAGVAIEPIVNSALGGERFFQLGTGGTQAPVAKAFLQSTLASPFDIIGGDTLAITVGEITYQHVFANSDFLAPGAATAYEITASVNADAALGFEALTAGSGTYVVFRAIAQTEDSLQIELPTTSGRNASVLLGLSSSEIETLRLYKNNLPLSKDGTTATVSTQAQSLWSNTIAQGDTLTLSVDGTAPITYTFMNIDFINTGSYVTVAASNSLAAWAAVFNYKLTGVTAEVVGTQIQLTSNLGISTRAQVVISSSSTLVTKGMFSVALGLSSTGTTSDYTLDRNTAQFSLNVALSPGDLLSAGTASTEGSVISGLISSGSIAPTASGHFWVLIDDPTVIIHTGVAANTTLTVSTPSTNIVQYTSSVSGAFTNVLAGDYLIIWSPQLNAFNQLEGRVHYVDPSFDYVQLLVTAAEYALVVPQAVTFTQGFVVSRNSRTPQKFKIVSGSQSLDQIAQALQLQTEEITFSVQLEQYIVITTNTADLTGSITVITADAQGQLLNLPTGSTGISTTSLIASYDNGLTEASLPLFFHTTFASGVYANPIDSFIQSFDSSLSLASFDPNYLVSILQPYGSAYDAQPYAEYTQISSITGGTTVDINNYLAITSDNPDMRRFRTVDRFFLANPLDFGYNDTLVATLDSNLISETYTIPLYRTATTNTTDSSNPNNFNAYDTAAGATSSFTASFGTSFDFSNFKVLMQAKKVLKPSPTKTAILYRSVPWGRSGESVSVSYIYPALANSPITSSVTSTSNVNIQISLQSGVADTTSIDGTTQWNVTSTPNTPSAGSDQVTYTWNTVGSAPNLTLSGGEYVNISTQTGFSSANQGVFRVSTQAGFAPTSTSFTIQRATNSEVVESNKQTLVPNGIQFYEASPTTAAQIVTYVNANLASYITATLALDGDLSGSGVIVLSTYQDSGFTYSSISLQDGLNWIYSSNISGSPQFVLKRPLSLPTDIGYAFNNGEVLQLIPTTIDQVSRFTNVLAVTGFTSGGLIESADRGTKLALSTDTIGSAGSIQIFGGLANGYQTPVLGSAANLNNQYCQISASIPASAGILSDQWFRLAATIAQTKKTLFGSNTSISLYPNTPIANETTVTLLNRLPTQRYFGKPRANVRVRGLTFKIENQGSLACLSWNGIGTSPDFLQSPLNFNDSGGGTVSVSLVTNSQDSIYTILTGNANFTELSIGDLLTVSGLPTTSNNGTFLVTGVSDNGLTAQVLNPLAAVQSSVSFVSGQFIATSGVSEGDNITISAPFSPLNQGQFRVIREFNNSVWYENVDVVNEDVTLPDNLISLGFDSTTSFNVDASEHTLKLSWNGTGTEPLLGNANMGDVVTFGTAFASANQGNFMVFSSGAKLQQISQFSMPSGSAFTLSTAGQYFFINNAGNVNMYYVWFNVNGTNTDPVPFGYTGIEVAILNGDNSTQVATKTAIAINTSIGITAVSSGLIVTTTTTGYNLTTDPSNFNMPSFFSILVLQEGRATYLNCINPAAVTQASVLVTSGVLECDRPQILFSEYDVTQPGDIFTVTGSTLSLANAGTYTVVQVLDRDHAIVKGNMVQVLNASLNNATTSVYVVEQTPYTAYKKTKLISAQPGSTTQNLIAFYGFAQYDKINNSAGVALTSLGKLDYPTTIQIGLDSYRYNTGLIAEANRIVYGDPRDSFTYPGVSAAGADIFIRAPLALRVQVSIDIRTATGVPFSNIVTQIRSQVSSLVNSNPIGQAIAISSIVAVVSEIPGIISVSIANPNYSTTNDLIAVPPMSKTLIINPTTDIGVTLITG